MLFSQQSAPIPRKHYEDKLNESLQTINRIYKKNDPKIYELVNQLGNEAEAIIRAMQLMRFSEEKSSFAQKDPCTTVFSLIEALNEYKRS